MQGISFFTPFVFHPVLRSDSDAFLELVDDYFYIGGDRAHVARTFELNTLKIDFISQDVTPCWLTALKILSYATIVIPLLLLIAKIALRPEIEFYPAPAPVVALPIDMARELSRAQEILGGDLSEEEKWRQCNEIGALLSQNNILPAQGGPTVGVICTESRTEARHAYELPLSFILQSETLLSQLIKREEREDVVLILDYDMTMADVAASMNVGSYRAMSREGLSRVARFIHYCGCKGNLAVRAYCAWDNCYPFLSSAKGVSPWLTDPFSHTGAGKEIVADRLTRYIHGRSNDVSMEKLCQELKDVPSLQEYARECPIKLGSFPISVTNDDLVQLATIFPCVSSLNLHYNTSVTEIPEAWKATLLSFKPSERMRESSRFKGISSLIADPASSTPFGKALFADLLDGMIQWNSGDFLRTTTLFDKLSEIPGFSKYVQECPVKLYFLGSQLTNERLQKFATVFPCVSHLDVSATGVTEIPEVWKATLRSLNVSRTPMTAAPTGCKYLEEFEAYGAEQLDDITGLNGLLELRKISISDTRVRAAPTGCVQLEIFLASQVQQLDNITGLNGLQKLRWVSLNGTGVTTGRPQDCPALIEYEGPLTVLL